MSAKEKQAAAQRIFVFLALINEQTVCEADKKRESASLRVLLYKREEEQTVHEADKKRESASLRLLLYKRKEI